MSETFSSRQRGDCCRSPVTPAVPSAPRRGGAGPAALESCRPTEIPATARLELELPRSSEAPRLARQRLADWLAPDLNGCELHDAALLSTELVTNAVVHGRGRIELRAELDANRLLIEVVDQGHGFEPVRDERDRLGGLGLNLVEALSSRWGIHEGSSHVWCELERGGSAHQPES